MTSKEAHRHYNESSKGRARRLRYEQSERGKEVRGLYIESGRSAEVQRERYHYLQDYYGCHHAVRDWLPAYRFIEALQDAEVVEIKTNMTH